MATVTRIRLLRRRDVSYGIAQVEFEQAWKIWKETDGQTAEMTPSEVLTALKNSEGVDVGSSFPNLPGVRCHDISFATPDEIFTNVVVARYKVPDTVVRPNDFSKFIEESQQNDPNNPLRPKFSGGVNLVEEFVWKDLTGKWLKNSANDPIDPPPTQVVAIQVRRVTVSEKEEPDTSKVWTAEGRKLYADCSYTESDHVNKQTGVSTRYFEVSYEVWTHPIRDWTPTVYYDAGYNELVNENGARKKRPIVNPETNSPFNSIQFLDRMGRWLGPDKDPLPIEFLLIRDGTLEVPFLS